MLSYDYIHSQKEVVMNTLEIMGTVYQVEQRGQYRDEESLGKPAPSLNSPTQRLHRKLGETLIRLGEKLKGQAEQPLPIPSAHIPTSTHI
jgi:hypothetical protein